MWLAMSKYMNNTHVLYTPYWTCCVWTLTRISSQIAYPDWCRSRRGRITEVGLCVGWRRKKRNKYSVRIQLQPNLEDIQYTESEIIQSFLGIGFTSPVNRPRTCSSTYLLQLIYDLFWTQMCQGDSSVVDSRDSQELSLIQHLKRTNPGKFKRWV